MQDGNESKRAGDGDGDERRGNVTKFTTTTMGGGGSAERGTEPGSTFGRRPSFHSSARPAPPTDPPASASTVGCQFRFPLAAGQAPAGPGGHDDEEQEREGDFSREGEPCPARAGGPEASDRRQGERKPEEARGRRGCLVSFSGGAEGEGGAGGRGEAEERKGPSGEGKDPGAEGRGGQGKAAARRGEEKVRPAPRTSKRGPHSRRPITDPTLSVSLSLSVRIN